MNWLLAAQLASMFGFGYLAGWGDLRRRIRRQPAQEDA